MKSESQRKAGRIIQKEGKKCQEEAGLRNEGPGRAEMSKINQWALPELTRYLLLLILGIEPRFSTQTLRRRSRGEGRKFGNQETPTKLSRAALVSIPHTFREAGWSETSYSLQCWDCTPAPTHYEGLPPLAPLEIAYGSPVGGILSCSEVGLSRKQGWFSQQLPLRSGEGIAMFFPLWPQSKRHSYTQTVGKKTWQPRILWGYFSGVGAWEPQSWLCKWFLCPP